MNQSESSMLVYLAAAVGAAPKEAGTFKEQALAICPTPSDQFLEAVEKLLALVQDADPSRVLGYRKRLLNLARDHKIVSGASAEYPLSAAKSAILTALDYSDY